MLSERLQILVTPEQRERLREEAKRRGTSVGGVIRETVDEKLGTVSREDRLRALEAIKAMSVPGSAPSPEELNRIIGEEREANFDPDLL
jgi:hypothetical protein